MVAFVLSLMGGIFILLGGGIMSMFRPYGLGGMMSGYLGYEGMGRYSSGPAFGMMGGYGFGGILGLAGVVFGIVVIVGAVMLYNKPSEHSKWGLLILIFSVLSIFGSAMPGFRVGLILGVLGGIFALTWKPPTTSKT